MNAHDTPSSPIGLLLASGAVLAAMPPAAPGTDAGSPQPAMKSLHPNFALLDAGGANVLASGQAVSTMKSCGQCHDTGFIASHAFHV